MTSIGLFLIGIGIFLIELVLGVIAAHVLPLKIARLFFFSIVILTCLILFFLNLYFVYVGFIALLLFMLFITCK